MRTQFRVIASVVAWLVCLLMTSVNPTMGQDEVCNSLQELYAEYGDELIEYLSNVGEDCLSETESVSTSTVVETGEVIWSEEGSGSAGVSVSLELSPGMYSLALVKPSEAGDWGHIFLDEIIAEPESCFPWFTSFWGSVISFPSLLPIKDDCRLFATLQVESSTNWGVEIKQVSGAIPSPIRAQDWSAKGRGKKYVIVDISFSPGIYRFEIDNDALGGDENYGGMLDLSGIRETPRVCLTGSILNLPVQKRIKEDCHVYATLDASLYGDNANEPWEVTIIKLD